MRTFAEFCHRHGALYAPHAATTMAPALFAAQLDAGAWGLTAATANQVLALRSLGVRRVILANELLDPVVLRWVAQEIEHGFEFYCQVDSAAKVEAISDLMRTVPGSQPLKLLAEIGYPGGRTGCRTAAEVDQVAIAALCFPKVELAGVAAYEGGLPGVAEVREYLGTVRDVVGDVEALALFTESVIVAVGGSR